jgi:hypothetical protein
LNLTNGLFRFQAVKGDCHSTGALYISCLNNPRVIRNLQEEVALIMAIPGPFELMLPQLNKIAMPFIKHMRELGDGEPLLVLLLLKTDIFIPGVEFEVHGHLLQELVHSQILSNASDLPASRTVSGLAPHNCKYFMCTMCNMPFYSLTNPDCFDPSSESLFNPQ